MPIELTYHLVVLPRYLLIVILIKADHWSLLKLNGDTVSLLLILSNQISSFITCLEIFNVCFSNCFVDHLHKVAGHT